MEVFLNAVWVLVASLGALSWHILGQRPQPGRRERLALTALACALVLLFPIISVTDDLRAEQTPVEDAAATVKKLKSTTENDRGHHHPLTGALTSAAAHSPREVESLVEASLAPAIRRVTLAAHCGRAPPVPLL
jgi:choline-glycine betaine transporter